MVKNCKLQLCYISILMQLTINTVLFTKANLSCVSRFKYSTRKLLHSYMSKLYIYCGFTNTSIHKYVLLAFPNISQTYNSIYPSGKKNRIDVVSLSHFDFYGAGKLSPSLTTYHNLPTVKSASKGHRQI